jgi:hypothetical protein
MGTENAGPLLYALACMRRPHRTLAIGLGYSTLFLLKALSDFFARAEHDRLVLAGKINDPARREILDSLEGEFPVPKLVGIDDFSQEPERLDHMMRCIERLRLSPFFELRRGKCSADLIGGQEAYEMIWIDCGHQIEYPELLNMCWPVLEDDGGILGIHYTYVDVALPSQGVDGRMVIPGPWANAVKRQMLEAGVSANFELLSLVESHKFRQGSLTLLRKTSQIDRCRAATLDEEYLQLYGQRGEELNNLAIDT